MTCDPRVCTRGDRDLERHVALRRRGAWLIGLCLVVTSTFVRQGLAEEPVPSESAANAAYAAKQWASCAALWQQLAKRTDGATKPRDALYNAACCDAQDGKIDLAFAMLDAAIAAGLRNPDAVERDPDLNPLHSDPRWAKALTGMREQLVAWERSLKAPQLRRELLAMVADDQAARDAWMVKKPNQPEWKALAAHVAEIDKKNTQALRDAIARYGWPGKDVVGEDGAHAAWLLAQHADLDLPLQKQVLARMKPLVKRHQVALADYAYLYDRVAVAEHRKQLYGTQFDGRDPFPIEDPAHVDERRHAIGLSSLAEYRQRILEMLAK